ncbi:hypothetical protein ACJIZ3_010983 [Penstemon smallii]|uniref:Uncharacterized protein n=1 Tax=Penstemon smallii TaxID=265156 RepID=A0ABD3UJI8_9LAMI
MSEKELFYCQAFHCKHIPCCGQGKYKYHWPELVGKNGLLAKETILKENPLVKFVYILKPDYIRGVINFCCNRVRIYVDKDGIVDEIPVAG